MKVQSDCDPRQDSANLLRHSNQAASMKALEPARNPHQVDQLNVRKSDYDNMEESLRDALRQGGRPVTTKDDPSKHMPQCETTITKHHNYITVYEHDQAQQGGKYRGLQKAENHRPHPGSTAGGFSPNFNLQQIASMGGEDFRKYCALLVNRVQQMEEQNHQLLRLAEKQKMEYNKVAAMVAQSEESQRRLQSECANLKHQIQQLITHNKMLREQQIIQSNQPSPNSPMTGGFPGNHGGFSQSEHNKQVGTPTNQTNAEFFRNLHSGVAGSHQNGLVNECQKNYQPSDIAAIVDLYAALQKSTLTDLGFATQSENSPRNGYPMNEHHPNPFPSLQVIQEHPERRHHRQHHPENHADYASPSSLCATNSCPCESRPSGELTPCRTRECKEHVVYSPTRKETQGTAFPFNPQQASSKPMGLQDGDGRQSFDNNSYVEVELKRYQKADEGLDQARHPSSEHFNHIASEKVRRDYRLRASHNHYSQVSPKTVEQRRPSSLVLDLGIAQSLPSPTFHQNQFQPVPTSVALSPVSPNYENVVFAQTNGKRNANNSNNNQANVQLSYQGERYKQQKAEISSPKVEKKSVLNKNPPKIAMSCKEISHSCPPDRRHASLSSFTSPTTSKKPFSRRSSITNLPPPPPPPPQTDEEIEQEDSSHPETVHSAKVTPIPRRVRSSSADHARTKSPDYNRSKFEKKEELRPKINEGFPRKLSVWRQHNEHHQASQQKQQHPDSQTEAKNIGWRRGSYAAACRKSQSLDHLYELMLLENGTASSQDNKDAVDNKEEAGTSDFSTLQFQRKFGSNPPSQDMNSLRPLHENLLSPTTEESETLSPTSPKHHYSRNADRPSPYEFMMPLKYQNSPPTAECNRKDFHGSVPTSPRSPQFFRLQKKSSNSESALFHSRSPVRHASKVPDFELDEEQVTSITDDVIGDDQVFEQVTTSNKPRTRLLSEGSTGRSRKECDPGKCHLRRHRSVESDVSINKKKEEVMSRCAEEKAKRLNSDSLNSPDKVNRSASGIAQQPRFPSTNPHLRLQPPATKVKRQDSNDGQKSPKQGEGTPVASSTKPSPLQFRPVENATVSQPHGGISKVSQNSAPLRSPMSSMSGSKDSILDDPKERGRSETKSSKKTKDNAAPGAVGKKKSSGNGSQSKSFVNIMKAKFARSTSGGRSSSGGKKGAEVVRPPDPFEISPIKPASASIDPRTLSLEPNSFLQTNKSVSPNDKKNSKQTLGKQSDAAVGRKLSQPFPNGIAYNTNSQSQTQLSKVVEEVLSDEGFAEGSTIERAEKESPTSQTTNDKTLTPQNVPSPRYVDVPIGGLNVSSNKLSAKQSRTPEKRNMPKKDNVDWYDSVVSLNRQRTEGEGPAHGKRFQVLPPETSLEEDPEAQASVKQRHTKNVMEREPPYENSPLDERLVQSRSLAQELSNRINKSRFESIEQRNHPNAPPGKEILATEVTLVRTSPSLYQSGSSIAQPSKRKSPARFNKSPSGGALGKLMQTVSSHYSSSREDLSGKDNSQGSEVRKTKYDQQKFFEKAFMHSVVQAELLQSQSQRSSIAEPNPNNNTIGDNPGHLAINSTSSAGESVAESVGTGSSFGSLPSDGLASSHSGDVIECQGITSSGSSDVPVKQQTQRMSKNKRNSASSFGFAGKTGTGGSSTSTSSSEMNFRGRSKLPGAGGLRPPARSSPPVSNKHPPASANPSSNNHNKNRNKSADPKARKEPQSPAIQQRSSEISESKPSRMAYVQKTQVASRLSRMSGSSKLPSSGKVSEIRARKGSDSASPARGLSQAHKIKLAPLNYGFQPSTASNKIRSRDNTPKGSVSEPVYENTSTIQHHEGKQSIKEASSNIRQNVAPQRQPMSSFGISVSSTQHGCGADRADLRRVKRGIPPPGALHRPRPIHPGVGAG
ncbi:unnamed protein product [Clavelina lepadiformis]|uniref:Uncharacterized protein n=2 Tax=Clavelina lepadiformis TaxID=159417 RepID=A0ABP0F4W4_CLALP